MAAVSRGDLLLTQFPFTDLRGSAVRPCLVVSQGLIGQDIIVAGISSVIRDGVVSTDVVVEPTHSEFPITGLRVKSVIRLHKLVTIEQLVIRRRLGQIGPMLQLEVDVRLKIALGL